MNWVWIRTGSETDLDFEKKYAKYFQSNVHGLFFEFDNELHYRTAKKNNMTAHHWIWVLNNNDPELILQHPEWYAINRNGVSCVEEQPYVDYYRWLCPNNENVVTYLKDRVKAIASKDYIDGIHLDYIRYCDVILPINLWSKYGLEQTKELGQYDYCYCETCRDKFKKIKGIDPLDIQYPDQSLSWRKFRYDSITTLVNKLSMIVHGYNKKITAAVFPTPEVAKRIVRQDWVNWDVDAIFPMIYHGFYNEDVNWIGDAVEEGVNSLHRNIPLYAGLFLPDFKNINELKKGILNSVLNGASGVSLFGDVDDAVLSILRNLKSSSLINHSVL